MGSQRRGVPVGWVVAGAIAGPMILAASLAEDVVEREPLGIDSGRAAVTGWSGGWHTAMVVASEIGAGAFPILVVSVVLTVLLLRHQRRHALFTVVAVEGAMAGGRLLKAIFERPRPGGLHGNPLAGAGLPEGRPVLLLAALAIGVVLLWLTPWRRAALLLAAIATAWLLLDEAWSRAIPLEVREDSFPSGHAVGSMAIAAALVVLTWSSRYRWAALLAGGVFAVAVGMSRVSLGYHFPSDVLAGWSTSVAWTAMSWWLLLRGPWPRRSASEALFPDGDDPAVPHTAPGRLRLLEVPTSSFRSRSAPSTRNGSSA